MQRPNQPQKHTATFKRFVFVPMAASFLWIAVTTFAPEPVGLLRSDGTVCPRPTVCTHDWAQLALLAVSRCSAYTCYPLIMLLFLSKASSVPAA